MEEAYARYFAMFGGNVTDMQTFATSGLFQAWLQYESLIAIMGRPMSRESFSRFIAMWHSGDHSSSSLLTRMQKDATFKAAKRKPFTPEPPKSPAVLPAVMPNPSAPKGYRIITLDGRHYYERIE